MKKRSVLGAGTPTVISRQQYLWPTTLLLVVLLSITLLFISGCGTGTPAPTYYVGTDGVKLELLQDKPPTVYENESFSISLMIRNLGPYNIPQNAPAKLHVNTDEKYLRVEYAPTTDYENIVLEGRSRANPLGAEEYYEFGFIAKEFSTKREQITTQLSYTLCYPYQTLLTTDVCIDSGKNLIDSGSAKTCIVKDYSGSNGQGGPLIISRIVTETLANRNSIQPSFKIYLENRGEGYALKAEQDAYVCNFNDFSDSTQWNRVSLSAQLSGQDLVCTPQELRLSNTDSYIRCKVPDAALGNFSRGKNTYVSYLTVKINYGYLTTKTMDIAINSNKEFSLQPFVQKDSSNTVCPSYEKFDDSKKQCIPLCDYCISNPGAGECQKNIKGNFSFTKNPSCHCTRLQCTTKSPKGECAFGYCPGEGYCCY